VYAYVICDSVFKQVSGQIPTVCIDQKVLKLMTILKLYVSVVLKEPLGVSYRRRVPVLIAEYSSWNVVVTVSLDGVKQPFAFVLNGEFSKPERDADLWVRWRRSCYPAKYS